MGFGVSDVGAAWSFGHPLPACPGFGGIAGCEVLVCFFEDLALGFGVFGVLVCELDREEASGAILHSGGTCYDGTGRCPHVVFQELVYAAVGAILVFISDGDDAFLDADVLESSPSLAGDQGAFAVTPGIVGSHVGSCMLGVRCQSEESWIANRVSKSEKIGGDFIADRLGEIDCRYSLGKCIFSIIKKLTVQNAFERFIINSDVPDIWARLEEPFSCAGRWGRMPVRCTRSRHGSELLGEVRNHLIKEAGKG